MGRVLSKTFLAACVAAALVLLAGCSLASVGTSNKEEIPFTGGEMPPGFDEYELSKSDVRAEEYQHVADTIGVDAFWVPLRPYVPDEVEAVSAVGAQCVLGIAHDPMGDSSEHYIVQLLSRYDSSANIFAFNMSSDAIAAFIDDFRPECDGERPFDPANHGFEPDGVPSEV